MPLRKLGEKKYYIGMFFKVCKDITKLHFTKSKLLNQFFNLQCHPLKLLKLELKYARTHEWVLKSPKICKCPEDPPHTHTLLPFHSNQKQILILSGKVSLQNQEMTELRKK